MVISSQEHYAGVGGANSHARMGQRQMVPAGMVIAFLFLLHDERNRPAAQRLESIEIYLHRCERVASTDTVTTVPRSYISRMTFRICPSFSSMTSSTFYELLPLTHAYDFHMLMISHVYDFTCLQLSHVNCFHMLLLYLFCMITLYYISLL